MDRDPIKQLIDEKVQALALLVDIRNHLQTKGPLYPGDTGFLDPDGVRNNGHLPIGEYIAAVLDDLRADEFLKEYLHEAR